MEQIIKQISVFDVLSKMPEGSVKLTYNTGGGKQLGKKHGNNAIIEFVVDNETFQDFAFQRTYGHAKNDNGDMYFMAVIFSKEQYDAIHEQMKSETKD